MIDPGMLVSKYGIKIAEREMAGGVKDRDMYKGDRKGEKTDERKRKPGRPALFFVVIMSRLGKGRRKRRRNICLSSRPAKDEKGN